MKATAKPVLPRQVAPVTPLARAVTVLLAAMALAGCAAGRMHSEGLGLAVAGDPQAALEKLHTASQMEPENAEYKLDYLRLQQRVVGHLLDEADQLRAGLYFDAAGKKLDAAVRLDPANERARTLRAAVALDRHDAGVLKAAMQLVKQKAYDKAETRVRQVLAENPNLPAAHELAKEIAAKRRRQQRDREEKLADASVMKKPVTLQFRDANVRMVFEALARTSGLNVIFDRDVRPDLKTTIFVNNATLEDTVNLILLQNQLQKKVLNANTLFIYPATAAKEKEYQELKVRTFQLSNIEAKQVESMLKTLLKVKDIVIDERANTVTLRDTPETIRVAEKMIAAHDLPEPEVMLEVKVLEVSHDRATDLGIHWPTSFGVATPDSADTLGALRHLTRGALTATPLAASANFKLIDTDANLLASPSIRTRNKEKAKILIGDKVPVISSSSTPSTSGPSYAQSIQYLDVGIKLDVEPQVYRNNDVGIKLNLEVSNITNVISSNNPQTGLNSLAYQIGTRSASTSLRLKDGETQVLGGLIQDEDRRTADKVPGLGQLPIAGRLFSDHSGDHKKTEIVLLITPHIIRPQQTADVDVDEVWSGTDSHVSAEQMRLDPTGEVHGGQPAHPGTVGGGAMGGALPAGQHVIVPPTGAFGQLPAAPRVVPPPAPFGGRFATVPMAPPRPVPAPGTAPGTAAAPAPAPAAAPAARSAAAPAPTAASAAPTPAPATTAAPGDIPSSNPLHPIGQ